MKANRRSRTITTQPPPDGEERFIMPTGPRGEKRPADLIGCAVKVARIATGEADDDRYTAPGRSRSGQAGGSARSAALSPEQRREIAQKAANVRWG